MEKKLQDEFLDLEQLCKLLLVENRFFKIISTTHGLELVEGIARKRGFWRSLLSTISPITHGKYVDEGDYLEQIANCEILSRYILKRIQEIGLETLPIHLFEIIRRVVDDCYLYVKRVTSLCYCEEERKKEIRSIPLAMKLGGKVPVCFLLDGKNEPFVRFILNNYLHHSLFALRLFLPYDPVKGPSIPIAGEGKTSWIPWREISEVKNGKGEVQGYFNGVHLFTVDQSYKFTENYCCFYQGILRYSIYNEGTFIPFDRQDPKRWDDKHILEIWTVCQRGEKPSMFYHTHAFMVIKDDQGYLYAVGQDSVLHLPGKIRVLQILSTKPAYGLLPTPDLYVIYPQNARRFWSFSFEITKEQMGQIIRLVERDRDDVHRTLSFGRKNCVSYIKNILKEVLFIEIDPSMYVSHILLKSTLPTKWYRFLYKRFSPIYQNLHPGIRKALFFFPPYYIIHMILAIIVRFLSQKNIPGQEDYTIWDSLIRPWNLSAHHPLQLHRKLEKLQRKK